MSEPSLFPTTTPDALTARGILDSCRDLAARIEATGDPWSFEPERLELETTWSEDQAWSHVHFTADTRDEVAAARFRTWQLELEPAWLQGRWRLDQAFCSTGTPTTGNPLARRLADIRGRRLGATRPGDTDQRAAADTVSQRVLLLHASLRVKLGQPGPEPTPTVVLGELRSPDRVWREHVWRAIESTWAAVAPELDALYTERINGFARQAGAEGGDTRAERLRFRKSVLQHAVPLIAEQRRLQARALGLPVLRPWDLVLEPRAARPLVPWRDTCGLLDAASTCLATVVAEASAELDNLRATGLLDLDPRPGKAPGAYTCPLDRSGRSVVFMNAGITANDLQILIHEAGHVLQTRVCHNLAALDLREVCAESAELAALTLELLTLPATEALWGHPRTARAWRRELLLQSLHRLAQSALLEAFEEEVLDGLAPDGATRAPCFLRLFTQYLGPGVDLAGCETAIGGSWQRALGLFLQPMESGGVLRAQAGALALRLRADGEADGTHRDWLAALALGNTVPVSQVYHRAGLSRFPDEAQFARLMESVRLELED